MFNFLFIVPERCFNPNGRSGLCISIYHCKSLLNSLQTHKPSAFEFARQSECPSNGQGRRPFVCCTSDTGFITRLNTNGPRIIFPDDEHYEAITTTSTTVETPRDKENIKNSNEVLPKPPVCGPIAVNIKIYGGEETDLGEFPWLANLEYKKRKLINE